MAELETQEDNGDETETDQSIDQQLQHEQGEALHDIDEDNLQSFLRLKEHGQSSRTKALRLKEDDVVVAIDGNTFHETSDAMVDLLSSGEEDDKWLLTIWRNGKFFEIFTRGPLGGIFEPTRLEETKMIHELFQKREMGQKEEYRIFEALRDVKRVVDIYDTSHSNVAVILPPIWLIQQKMWEPLLAIICVYLITFSVNIFLFILAVVLIAMYFRKGQVTLRRSYGMFQDRQVWAVLAARSELEAQEMCRDLDEKVNFINSLVKPFKKVMPKSVKKNKSGNVVKVSQEFT